MATSAPRLRAAPAPSPAVRIVRNRNGVDDSRRTRGVSSFDPSSATITSNNVRSSDCRARPARHARRSAARSWVGMTTLRAGSVAVTVACPGADRANRRSRRPGPQLGKGGDVSDVSISCTVRGSPVADREESIMSVEGLLDERPGKQRRHGLGVKSKRSSLPRDDRSRCVGVPTRTLARNEPAKEPRLPPSRSATCHDPAPVGREIDEVDERRARAGHLPVDDRDSPAASTRTFHGPKSRCRITCGTWCRSSSIPGSRRRWNRRPSASSLPKIRAYRSQSAPMSKPVGPRLIGAVAVAAWSLRSQPAARSRSAFLVAPRAARDALRTAIDAPGRYVSAEPGWPSTRTDPNGSGRLRRIRIRDRGSQAREGRLLDADAVLVRAVPRDLDHPAGPVGVAARTAAGPHDSMGPRHLPAGSAEHHGRPPREGRRRRPARSHHERWGSGPSAQAPAGCVSSRESEHRNYRSSSITPGLERGCGRTCPRTRRTRLDGPWWTEKYQLDCPCRGSKLEVHGRPDSAGGDPVRLDRCHVVPFQCRPRGGWRHAKAQRSSPRDLPVEDAVRPQHRRDPSDRQVAIAEHDRDVRAAGRAVVDVDLLVRAGVPHGSRDRIRCTSEQDPVPARGVGQGEQVSPVGASRGRPGMRVYLPGQRVGSPVPRRRVTGHHVSTAGLSIVGVYVRRGGRGRFADGAGP